MERTRNDELLTIKEAAAVLKVSTITLSRWLKQGRLVGYRIGPRSIRLHRYDVEALLAPGSSSEVSTVQPEQELPSLTTSEVAEQSSVLERATALRSRMRQARGGRLLPSSAEMIARERQERSRAS